MLLRREPRRSQTHQTPRGQTVQPVRARFTIGAAARRINKIFREVHYYTTYRYCFLFAVLCILYNDRLSWMFDLISLEYFNNAIQGEISENRRTRVSIIIVIILNSVRLHSYSFLRTQNINIYRSEEHRRDNGPWWYCIPTRCIYIFAFERKKSVGRNNLRETYVL